MQCNSSTCWAKSRSFTCASWSLPDVLLRSSMQLCKRSLKDLVVASSSPMSTLHSSHSFACVCYSQLVAAEAPTMPAHTPSCQPSPCTPSAV
jgi:hypothetical protein